MLEPGSMWRRCFRGRATEGGWEHAESVASLTARTDSAYSDADALQAENDRLTAENDVLKRKLREVPQMRDASTQAQLPWVSHTLQLTGISTVRDKRQTSPTSVTHDKANSENHETQGVCAKERAAGLALREAQSAEVLSETSAQQKAAQEADELAEYEAAVALAKKIPLPKGNTWRQHGGAELEPLLEFTTLICVRWLLRFARGEEMQHLKGAVPSWQELPPEAEVRVEQLRTSTWKDGLPVGVLSYGWASRAHPDPTGAQLKRLIPFLQAIVDKCDENGRAAGFVEASILRKPTWGILWDVSWSPVSSRAPLEVAG